MVLITWFHNFNKSRDHRNFNNLFLVFMIVWFGKQTDFWQSGIRVHSRTDSWRIFRACPIRQKDEFRTFQKSASLKTSLVGDRIKIKNIEFHQNRRRLVLILGSQVQKTRR